MVKDTIKKFMTSILGSSFYFKLRWLLLYGRKYSAISGYWDIDGWLPECEAMALYDAAIKLTDNQPVAVEIGSWQGKSSVIIAKGIKNKNNPLLYCIDPFDASSDAQGAEDLRQRANKLEVTLKEIFLKNITKCNVRQYIKVLEGKSQDFVNDWQEKIDFLFIDGDHSYEAILGDFLSWSKFIKSGGYIALHDVMTDSAGRKVYYEGPYKVVKDYILNSDDWLEKNLTSTLFIARKK